MAAITPLVGTERVVCAPFIIKDLSPVRRSTSRNRDSFREYVPMSNVVGDTTETVFAKRTIGEASRPAG